MTEYWFIGFSFRAMNLSYDGAVPYQLLAIFENVFFAFIFMYDFFAVLYLRSDCSLFVNWAYTSFYFLENYTLVYCKSLYLWSAAFCISCSIAWGEIDLVLIKVFTWTTCDGAFVIFGSSVFHLSVLNIMLVNLNNVFAFTYKEIARVVRL